MSVETNTARPTPHNGLTPKIPNARASKVQKISWGSILRQCGRHASAPLLPDLDGRQIGYEPLAGGPIDTSTFDHNGGQRMKANWVAASMPIRSRHLPLLPPDVHRHFLLAVEV